MKKEINLWRKGPNSKNYKKLVAKKTKISNASGTRKGGTRKIVKRSENEAQVHKTPTKVVVKMDPSCQMKVTNGELPKKSCY